MIALFSDMVSNNCGVWANKYKMKQSIPPQIHHYIFSCSPKAFAYVKCSFKEGHSEILDSTSQEPAAKDTDFSNQSEIRGLWLRETVW